MTDSSINKSVADGTENAEVEQTKSNSDSVTLTAEALNAILRAAQPTPFTKQSTGFPCFNPDQSRIDVRKWCDDIEARVKRDNLENFDVIPRVREALMGRAQSWYEKYGFQYYEWADLRSSLIYTFTSGADVVSNLRKVANIESDGFNSYTDFVMEKVSQVSRLPFEIPEEQVVRIIVGCISATTLRNSLTFVMPTTVQGIIDSLSCIRERPHKKHEPLVRKFDNNIIPYVTRSHKRGISESPVFNKRIKNENDKRCYDCGEFGHIRSRCTKANTVKNNVIPNQNYKGNNNKPSVPVCEFCGVSGHDESKCWAKQRAERKNVNICESALFSNTLTPVVINGHLFRCVLDTGADCSLIRDDVANRLTTKRSTHFVSLLGIGTDPILATECLEVLVEFEEVIVEVSFYVVDRKYLHSEMIIGKDVLKDPSLMIVANSSGSSLVRSKSVLSCVDQKFVVSCAELSPVDGEKLKTVLTKYSVHFIAGFPTARVNTGSLNIRLTKETTISYRPYRMSHSERRITKEIITELLSNGIIRESRSPFSSPMILVKKKNGQNRLCVDFRALNKVTVKDRYPLPRIDDQLDELTGNKLFTSLDMASGFHQIPIADGSIEKTAFVTPDGHYEYLCMPFGHTYLFL